VTSQTQLSPLWAVVLGLIFAAFGIVMILGGVGVLHLPPVEDGPTPPWVLGCVGLAFVFVGAAVIVGFAVTGGSGPDGELPAGTPFSVRLIQYFLGLGTVASLTAVFTWIAFGPGERHFSTTVVTPFTAHRGASDDTVASPAPHRAFRVDQAGAERVVFRDWRATEMTIAIGTRQAREVAIR
jgi:hypothetical protein